MWQYIPELLECMFTCGLSAQFLKTLFAVYTYVHSARSMIEDRLSRIVWTIVVQNAHGTIMGGTDVLCSRFPISSITTVEEKYAETSSHTTKVGVFGIEHLAKNTTQSNNQNEGPILYNNTAQINMYLLNASDLTQLLKAAEYVLGPSHLSFVSPPQYHVHNVTISRMHTDSLPISPPTRPASLSRHGKAEFINVKPIRFAPQLVKLALKALAIFNLPDVNVNLLHFIRQTVAVSLDDENSSVRKQAAVTSCKLLLRAIGQMETEKRQLNAYMKELISSAYPNIKKDIIKKTTTLKSDTTINKPEDQEEENQEKEEQEKEEEESG